MSEGGFDIEAYRKAIQTSESPDRALLVTFEPVATKQPDGSYQTVEYTRIWLGRNDEVFRPTTSEDRVRFADRYAAFKRGEEKPIEGTPISMCAFATPADVAACKAEKIFTLEQIVELPDERLQRARLVTFKYRCRDWLEAQQRHGYVGELRTQIEALQAKVNVLTQQLQEQGKTPAEVPEVTPITTKRRGRPPKVRNEDATATG